MPGVGRLLRVKGRNKTRGKINETLRRLNAKTVAVKPQKMLKLEHKMGK